MEQRSNTRNVQTRRAQQRKIQQRKRKRLIRRIIRFVWTCICLGILAAVLVLAVKLYQHITPGDAEQMAEEGYPESLVELMERNPETKEFVRNYLKNKDKDFEIDLSEEVTEGTIPLFLQWDERWGYEKYGSDFMAITGCGPTCLSMVRCGLSGDTEWNPLKVAEMAEEQGYYVDGAGSSWDLMTEGAAELGLIANSVIYDAEHIMETLDSGTPIICIMRPGDFTTSGHFIVLTGVDEDGKVTVCDPNSRINSEKSWEVDDLIPQIKNLWSYQY